MQRNQVAEANLPQYPGDDIRPTSKKELVGWYSYGWAAEVFAVCAMGSFLPITLEQMARERGVLLSDQSIPCSASWNHSRSHAQPALLYEKSGAHRVAQCVVNVLGFQVNTASFAMYTFSVSVFVQAILIVSMSGAADHGSHRKMLLVLFAFAGSAATMVFLAISPSLYILGALSAVVANTCFGASFVLLNSFLPLLVRHHPSLLAKEVDGSPVPVSTTISHSDAPACTAPRGEPAETTPLFRSNRLRHIADSQHLLARNNQELEISSTISSYGIGIGYIGAVILQGICIAVVFATKQSTFSLRLVLFLIGAWWFFFTIPAAIWLRSRPGPPLPYVSHGKKRGSWGGYFIYAWKSLGQTAMRTRHMKDILLFLASWFLLSDGVATVSGTAVLFAKTQLGMQPAALGLINVVAMAAGVIGAFSWGYVARFFGLSASQIIILCILLLEIVPLYGLLGFIPAIRELGFLGLQQPWEMYALGIVYGLVMGGLSSYCRSFFGQLIPTGYEAAFYALYAITDKGSSIFGPVIVGIVTDRYGEIRPAFVFLAILILFPLPLMLLVDVDRGKRDALALATELAGEREVLEPLAYGTVPCDSTYGEPPAMESE
ncbi:MFS transporter [Aspergillus homomorphus CBS 101889]|uniref:Autophagy-related protein n=1 Tax=Aspergillus homomorphus (strain CBS 101889) TaxID=1450537 RepID=A0A395HI33_ASPHC|nr:MFS general substrate transporter [Aspergillus homomorphus CBS 101889]RAL07561.1 MFS general substrate transporter [Aspergillus homomorphus CBS 101889]